MKKARWTRKTHLFRSDEYTCSACKSVFSKPFMVCPACQSPMKETKYDPSWMDEAEMLSAIVDDNW